MIDLSGTCRRHRSALFDFVDRGEISPGTALALAHLDRCDRCTDELETTVLAITALRRLGEDAARMEPSADAWPRLRARIDRWRAPRWRFTSPTAGAVMSMAIVALLVVPLRLVGGSSGVEPAAASANVRDAASLIEQRTEADYISSSHRGTLPAGETIVQTTGSVLQRYPDNYVPDRKEVSPADSSGRPLEAI